MAERSEGIVVTQEDYNWLVQFLGRAAAKELLHTKLGTLASTRIQIANWLADDAPHNPVS